MTTTKTGYILIQGNKIIFVYHELSMPSLNDFYGDFEKDQIKYLTSKREVEVGNVDSTFRGFTGLFAYIKIGGVKYVIKHKQPCEAEVNDKAIIIKIL